ncbi:MAG TPA: hypothetical protein VFT65_10280 [Candidatus Angelobacter sp.]|nr:hypothetical protein [Candidatus Angelobacter sp.]
MTSNPTTSNQATSSQTSANQMIESYFAALSHQLADLPQAKRDEVVRELRAHVLDRLAQPTPPTSDDCRAVLKAMGTPEEIARQYRVELLLKRSAWKIAPWSVLRTLSRWTLTGIQGYIVFVIAMIGYTMGIALYITALFKPLFPHNIGMFVSDHAINLARFPDPPPGTEMLGAYYVPIAVAAGYLFTLVTTVSIRGIVRKFGRLKQKISGIAVSAY